MRTIITLIIITISSVCFGQSVKSYDYDKPLLPETARLTIQPLPPAKPGIIKTQHQKTKKYRVKTRYRKVAKL